MGSNRGLAGRGACVLEQDTIASSLGWDRRKAIGPVCCVMHVKEPRALIVKDKGLAPVFLDSRLEHPAGWICARYKSSVLLLLIIIIIIIIITSIESTIRLSVCTKKRRR